jgi:DNA uptake protein ComE-like DNA-binding protein
MRRGDSSARVDRVADLVEARRAAGLTTKELAGRVGMSVWELDRLERDPSRATPELKEALQRELPWRPAADADGSAPSTDELAAERGRLETQERELRRREAELATERRASVAASERATAALAVAREKLRARERQVDDRSAQGTDVETALAAYRRNLDEAWARATLAERRVTELEALVEGAEAGELGHDLTEAGDPDAGSDDPITEPGSVTLGEATFRDLRGLGLSMTQAKRVLRYRDERGVIHSVEDLDRVPGLPWTMRMRLRRHLSA